MIAIPERLHIGEAWHRWAREFHADVFDPNRYRPPSPSLGIIIKNGVILPHLDFDDQYYTSKEGLYARDNFYFKIRTLRAFTSEGLESSQGQWELGEGGIKRIIIRDMARDDGGPLSWPALEIVPFAGNVFLNIGDFEKLVKSEHAHQIRRNPPTEAELRTYFKNIFGDKRPTLKEMHKKANTNFPGITRESLKPLQKEISGNRGRGRPKKSPK